MPLFTLTAPAVATGAVVGTYKTLLGGKYANTTGHRCRVRKLIVTPGGEAAGDVNVSIRLTKTNNAGDGTSTSVTAKKADDGSIASNLAAAGKNYTVEPTTVDSQHFWEGALNGRGGIIQEWARGEGPLIGPNQTVLVQGTPGAAAATMVNVTLEIEE